MSITPGMIKKTVGNYDVDTVRFLTLNHMKISRMINASLCVNLVELDLAHNEITVIEGLQLMPLLEKIDLSFNRIAILRPLAESKSVQEVFLQNNMVESWAEVEHLKALPLTRLDLRMVDGSSANPVCKDMSYRDAMLESFPDLKVLDGQRLADMYSVVYQEDDLAGLEVPESARPWVDAGYWDVEPIATPSALKDGPLAKALVESKRVVAHADKILAESGYGPSKP